MMDGEPEPYENSLSVEELRREVRRLWDANAALTRALIDLPEVPHWRVLWLLRSAGMNTRDPDAYGIGKKLQREHGLDAVTPKTEYECAAGLWSLLRSGVLAARESPG
jgi:hypothetical protein